MNLKKVFIILVVSFIVASVVSNFTEKRVRAWIEVLYEWVMQKPMVYDISQTDEKGIPFLIEGKIGKQRNPMTICNKALSYYEKGMAGDTGQFNFFLNCADWLADSLHHEKEFSVLSYNYNWPIYNMVSPWRSGLANGVALQVFIKAHTFTKNKKYLDAGKKLLNSFYVEVNDGGVSYKTDTSGWWFEEYADEGGVVSRVLNGHMFALVGIHEYYEYTKDTSANYLFVQGIKSLKNDLAKYDQENGPSFYDSRGKLTNIKYHAIHVDLLDQLFAITGEPVFKFYADKWRLYKHPSLMVRLVSPPVKPIDIAIWLFNFGIIAFVFLCFSFFYQRRTKRIS
jgi:heparosan-N-sulfate-glucuronate 5-epimerase